MSGISIYVAWGKTGRILYKKSFSLIHIGEINEELFKREFADRLVNGYKSLMPFYDYFAAAENEG